MEDRYDRTKAARNVAASIEYKDPLSQLDLSVSARYGQSVAISALPTYRHGLGVRYRFDEKEL